MKSKIFNYLFIIIGTFLIFNITILAEDSDENIITGSTYTLPDAQALLKAKLYRGHNQDRQNLGIYMPAGSSFKIRSKNGKNFSVDVLNDDERNEKVANEAYSVSSEWVTIEAGNYDSVPFLVNPSGEGELIYEIKDKTGVTDLVVFKKGGNENAFFSNWDTSQQKFAVVESDSFIFMIPAVDKEKLRNGDPNLYQFTSLSDMVTWYDNLVISYDRYVGLSNDAANIYDRNVKMRFLIKPNKGGIGAGAYYPFRYIYNTAEDLGGFLYKSWGPLHEVGHGYQHGYTYSKNNPNLDISEVANNIFAYYEEQKNLKSGDPGWLWTNHTQEDMINEINRFNDFNDLIEQTGVDSNNNPKYNYHFYERLFIFINLFDKIGMQQAMRKASSEYRRIKNQNQDIINSDLFGIYFSQGTNYNVIPYLNSMKIKPSKSTEDIIYPQKFPIVYPLAYIVNSNTAQTIASQKQLRGIYSVVENNDFKNYVQTNNINRNVKFNITTEDNHKLLNKTLYIKNSSDEIVKQQRISGNQVTIEDVPVGIYYVDISNGNISNLNYLLVRQDSSVLSSNINYIPDETGESQNSSNEDNSNTSNNSTNGDNSNDSSSNSNSSSDNNSSQSDLVINIDYDYDPKNYDDLGEVVNVPNTGISTGLFLGFGMILISLGIALFVYKKDVILKTR